MKVKSTLVWLAVWLAPVFLIAQISRPAEPPGFSLTDKAGIIPFERMAGIDLQLLQLEDEIIDTIRDIPWRFGENLEVDLNPANAGVWHHLANGDRLWQLGISSPGALSLNLSFNRYYLPPGAMLFVYSADQRFVLGAFTDFNNQADGYFATTLLPGDSLVIEYYEPRGVPFPGELNLEMVTHAYRDPFSYAKYFGDAGWCNLNVACEEAAGWEKQINSAVMLVVGGNGFCSGALINNTNNDATPLLLSAHHCIGSRDPGTLVVWFNWQSKTCENPGESPLYDSMSGAVTRANHSTSDFWLLELNQAIPITYRPYFAGWNRSLHSSVPGTLVGIHHPRGDIKKFSYADEGATSAAYLGNTGSGITHWRIRWSGGTTTQSASSGSPLFDSQGLVIGQLHGGYAACGNTLPDWYGRLGVSWTGGGADNNRLSNWLDPIGTNPALLPGYDPGETTIGAPGSFQAEAIDTNAIRLSWSLNNNRDKVMIAVNDENVFGLPSGPFALGMTIPGGGSVIYFGDANQWVHEELPFSTTKYYSIWSFSQNLNYSAPLTTYATTLAPVISNFPYVEQFDKAVMPRSWTQLAVEGALSWETGSGNGAGMPAQPWSGERNTYIRSDQAGGTSQKTRLITPILNLSLYDRAGLSFFYANAKKQDFQDELKIYYRSRPSASWELLSTLNHHQAFWREFSLDLPGVSDSTQLAFEATSRGGHGICLDVVTISGNYNLSIPSPINVTIAGNNSSATISWDMPPPSGNNPLPSGYLVFRNDELIKEIHDPSVRSFTDLFPPVGIYVYAIHAVYTEPPAVSKPGSPVKWQIIAGDTTYTLQTGFQGSGSVFPKPGSYLYNKDVPVSLQAFPGPNHHFSVWKMGEQTLSQEPSFTVIMDQNRDMKALFEKNSYTLNLASNPGETGQSEGAGIYVYGDTAQVSTTTPLGWSFQYWKDNGRIISTMPSFPYVVTQDATLVAYFRDVYLEVVLTADPSSGAILSGGGTYAYGSMVTVSGVPEKDYTFVRWEEDGELVSQENPYTFVITSDRYLIARLDDATTLPPVSSAPDEAVVRLFPIPASDVLQVEADGLSGTVSLEILQMSGRRLLLETREVWSGEKLETTISLRGISPGVYLLRISGSQQVVTKRLIVQ